MVSIQNINWNILDSSKLTTVGSTFPISTFKLILNPGPQTAIFTVLFHPTSLVKLIDAPALNCLDNNKWKTREKLLTKNDLLLLLYLPETRSEFSSLINKFIKLEKIHMNCECIHSHAYNYEGSKVQIKSVKMQKIISMPTLTLR